MCDECDEASLAAAYVRKVNRYGWRPPAAAATAPRLDDGRAAAIAPLFACAAAEATPCDITKVDRCA